MLSAIDRNHCPLSIGTDVRNHRKSAANSGEKRQKPVAQRGVQNASEVGPEGAHDPAADHVQAPTGEGQLRRSNREEQYFPSSRAPHVNAGGRSSSANLSGTRNLPQINSQVGQFQRPGLPIFDCSRGAALGKFETFRHVVGLLIAWIITLPAAALTVALCYL